MIFLKKTSKFLLLSAVLSITHISVANAELDVTSEKAGIESPEAAAGSEEACKIRKESCSNYRMHCEYYPKDCKTVGGRAVVKAMYMVKKRTKK